MGTAVCNQFNLEALESRLLLSAAIGGEEAVAPMAGETLAVPAEEQRIDSRFDERAANPSVQSSDIAADDGAFAGMAGEWVVPQSASKLQAPAAATWSGDIPDGTVWASGSVQRITGPARVAPGAKLTIQPGAIVQSNAFVGAVLNVEGTLDARGTAASPILFTSSRDDTGLDAILGTSDDRDTNGDGPSQGGGGDWAGLQFGPQSSASVLDHVDIRFAGASSPGSVLIASALTLSNSTVRNSSGAGIRIVASNPILAIDTVRESSGPAMSMDLASNPAVTQPDFSRNGINALAVDSGSLLKDGHWDDPDVVYWLAPGGGVTVPAGKSLTIAAGQVIKAASFNGDSLVVEGQLLANGAAGRSIVFTSDRDDSVGGDTNNDGNGTLGAADQWNRIEFTSASRGSILDFVEVRNAGASASAAIIVNGGELRMSNSTVTNSSHSGIRIQKSNPVLTSNSFQNNAGAALSMDLASNPSITGVTLAKNSINALAVDSGTLVGDGVWDDPDVVYWLNFGGGVIVPAGQTLTVAAGQVVKAVSYNGISLLIDGKLVANGTAQRPVIFTSDRDDSVGGDTNNDGNATSAASDQWNRIEFRPASRGSILEFVELRYGGASTAAALVVDGGELGMANSLVRNSSHGGVRIQKSNPTLTANTFRDNAGAALSMDLASNPQISGVTLATNQINGLAVDSGTLAANGFWDDPDVVYWMAPGGGVVVPAGKTLTVTPGQVVKAASYTGASLLVEGTLLASGVTGRPVIFTSDRDDAAGGDTNNDGNATAPTGDQWNRIEFASASKGSVLDLVELRYAGASSAGAIMVNGGELRLSNSLVRDSSQAGIRIQKSNPVLISNSFEKNGGPALSMDLASNPLINGITTTGNRINGLALDSGVLPGDAFWDDPDVVYWIAPGGGITVPAGKTLVIAAGQIIKANSYSGASFTIQGRLLANGASGRPVVFTSDRDDSIGGDTNNDSTATGPASDQWNRIEFTASSKGSVLDYTEIRYGSASSPAELYVNGGELVLNSSIVRDSSRAGLRIEGANPQGTGNRFLKNAQASISLDLKSVPVFKTSTFSENGTNGLVLDAGTVPGNLSLASPGHAYSLSGELTVPQGIRLTIENGAILDLQDFRNIQGTGTINQLGTLRKLSGSNVTSIAPAVLNSGVINAVTGPIGFTSLSLQGGMLAGQAPGLLSATGNWLGDSRSTGLFSALIPLSLNGRGTSASPQLFEVMSSDLGAEGAGYRNNFGLGSLVLEGGTFVRLVDNSDNAAGASAEALYVDRLRIASGTTLDLNGLHLYARAVENNGTVRGGTIALLPHAGPLLLETPTSGNLPSAGTTDEWTFFGRAGQVVTVTLSTGSGSAPVPAQPTLNFGQVSILDPSGAVLATAANAQSGADATLANTALAQDGLYHLRVQAPAGHANSSGNYVLTVWDATPRVFSANVNQTLTGKIDTPFRSEQWTFAAPAGQVLQFTLVNAERAGVQFDLTGPNGFTAFSGLSGSSDLLTLPAAGAYTVTARSAQRQTGAYAFRLDQSIPKDLVLGTPYTGSLAGSGQTQLFRVQVSEIGPLLVQFQDAAAGDQNEVYVKLGSAPTRADYQMRSANSASSTQTVNVPSAPPGTYYILVYSESVKKPGPFSLLVRQQAVFLTSVTPDHAGNSADASLTLTGLGFDSTATVALVSNGTSFSASSVQVDLPTQITAGFTAGALPAGVYSVKVTQAGGSSILLDAFKVVQGGKPQLEVNLVVPSSMGYHIAGAIYLEYANRGDVAIPAPILLFRPTQTHADGSTDANAFLTLDPSLVTAGFWTSARPAGFSDSIQILASGATPGVLQPGESRSVPVYYAGWQQPWDLSYPDFNYQVIVFNADDPSPVNWSALKQTLKPAGVDAGAWDIIFANLVSATGSTLGEYVRSLDRNAAYLGQLGQAVLDIGQLMAFQVAQAEGLTLLPHLGATTDAAALAPGLSLALARSFESSLSGRARLGPFGRGWAWLGPWDTRLTSTSDGTVTLSGSDGQVRIFQPDSRGGYLTRPGDFGVLTAGTAGGFVLREADGGVMAFRANGQVDYVEDNNHNRITAGYTGNLLTSLNHSAGQKLQIAYNAAGRITSVTDPAGRVTSYAYDAASEHLLKVTGFDGRSQTYTYSTADGPATIHALTGITDPDGVRQFFSYDARGRLIDVHSENGASQLTFNYGAVGAVSMTNAFGAATTYFFDHRGAVVKVEDPLHRTTIYSFDSLLRLTEAIDAAGQIYSYAYDLKGNVVQSSDPLGSTRRFTYGGPFNQLTAMTDGKGNTTRYTYDSNGNLASVIYPDGSQDRATYDAPGNVVSATNQRGQVIAYGYDSSGRLVSKTYPDGSHVNFVYDARGNLTSLTGINGTISFAYDAADRVTQVSYPDGRFLKYTYDQAGRRIRMEDQAAFVIVYAYDSLGQLSSLKDGAGNAISTYTYDSAGYLQKKQNGNGSSTTYEHDASGQLSHLVNTDSAGQILSRFDYTYDVLGRRVTMSTIDGVWTYTYDALGQLTRAVFASNNQAVLPNQDLAYTYDAAGNRVSEVVNGVTAAYTTNSLNQYLSAGSVTFAYDADGNLTQKKDASGTTTLTYDSENRLVSSSAPGDSWNYRYDAGGNLVATTHNGVAVSFLIDPAGYGNVVAEFDQSGGLLAHYVHAGDLVSRVSNSGAAFFQFDGAGNTVGVTGPNAAASSSYSYLPFGDILKSSGSGAGNFQFSGAFGVGQFDDNLSSMRARFYDPAIGRFVQADPLGTAADANLYRYAMNNPISNIDPSGLALDAATIATLSRLFNAAESLGLSNQASAIFRAAQYAIYEGSPTIATQMTGVGVNVQQLISGLEGLIARAGGAAVRVGGGLASAASPAATIATPVATVTAPAVTVTAPAVTVTAPAAAGAGTATATELAVGTGAVEVAAVEGVGAWGVAAGAGLVFLSGVGGVVVGTVINEAVLSEDTKELIGDTLLGIWESGGRLIDFIGNGFSHSQNVASRDPNDKIGPSGVGAASYVPGNQALPYRIDFENDKSATAPAQRVTVTDQLDASLDWSTFELREAGFGDTLLTIPAGSRHYQTVVPLTQNGQTFEVQIELGIHSDTGQVFATFQSIDPATSLPPDVLSGFLPPEDGSGRGMGYFTFVIHPKAGLPHATAIRNVALIRFDFNEVIATDQVDPHDPSKGVDSARQALVTIDARAPKVTNSTANGSLVQRSVVRQLNFLFDEDTRVQVGADAVQLVNQTTGQTISINALPFSYDAESKMGTLDLSSLTLPDGNYTLTLTAAAVTDSGGLALAQNYRASFHVLAGDTNGDRKTNDLDLYRVWSNLAKPAASQDPNADVNGDGKVDRADLDLIRAHYRTALPSPLASLAPGAAGPSLLSLSERNAEIRWRLTRPEYASMAGWPMNKDARASVVDQFGADREPIQPVRTIRQFATSSTLHSS